MRVYGREALIKATVASLQEGRSLVLSGAVPGVGLSTVCRQVLRRLTEAGDGAVVYLPQLRTEKPFWQEVCFQLGCAKEGAIYPGGGKDRVHILSDDGTRKVGGTDCKLLRDPARRSFRTVVLRY